MTSASFRGSFWAQVLILIGLAVVAGTGKAQTGGEAGIQGVVTDSTGAAVSHATVSATNQATGVVTTRETTGDGLYTIAPILPGIYTVAVKAAGFGDFTQKNLAVDALKLTGLNAKLAIGSQAAEVTVTDAPPQLETTNATLGGVLENKTYEALPLQMSGQQRDPTAFATLLPGTQSGTRAPIIGGTGNYLASVYVDGIPVTTINQQGDNRVVSNAIPVEAIDQFQVVTSSPDAEYSGAGLINFNLRSGANQYHGTAAAYVRARMFDAWSYASKTATIKAADGSTIPAPKPDAHQLEIVFAGGGPIPLTQHKGFFYATYDKYHGRSGVNPSFLTVPTALMRQGNFSELLPVKIYDPTSTAACTAANKGTLCRYAFPGNIIPQSYLSPIALKMQSFLPAPTNGNLINNYYGGVPSGFENWETTERVDYDVTSRQRVSGIFAYGDRRNVPFTVGGAVLPPPYTAGGYADIAPLIIIVEHAWSLNDHMTNQIKYGFDRFTGPVTAITDGRHPYEAAADLGITNLPAGQASTELPGASFGTTAAFPTALTPWTSNGASGATQVTVPNTFTLLDNFLWVKGQHSLTFGVQAQWLEDNVAAQIGPSGIYTIPYSANSTANFVGSSLSTTNTGFSYASFLLGAAGSSGIGLQSVSETGGRYHDVSPYVEDNWKVSPKLTLNVGLRWDYLPPFHEVHDRWSFLNPNLTNAITGTPGELQFAGNWGGAGVSCNCRTPVQTYWKNFGPRISAAYSVTPNTVLRAGYALVYSIGGGVGGRAGAGNGTGALGFNATATSPAEVASGSNAGPSYYLNNSTYFQQVGLANTNFGGPNYSLPGAVQPSAATQTLNTGNYVDATGKFVSPGSISYADPYLSGRAPEFDMFNAGIQQAITNNLTLTLNYAGTQSHFLVAGGSNARGYWTNQLNPVYLLALGKLADVSGAAPLLSAKATPANVALVQAALPGYKVPYAGISTTNTNATIAQTLVAFPQYSGVSDVWGQNVANLSYNSLQASLRERNWHGVDFTLNYTWSKNMGDDGTFRSGYDLPAGIVDGSTRAYKASRIDRSLTVNDVPHNISMYGFWKIPFGQNSTNGLVRALSSGWQVSSIYRFSSGTPFVVTYGGCSNPNGGTCEVDYNPNYTGNPRKYSGGMRRIGVPYVDFNAFKAPTSLFNYTAPNGNVTHANSLIGNVARTAPYGLRDPYYWNVDASVRRVFKIYERLTLTADVTCTNVANHPTMNGLTGAWADPGTSPTTAAAFGTISGARANARDFQFSGRFNF